MADESTTTMSITLCMESVGDNTSSEESEAELGLVASISDILHSPKFSTLNRKHKVLSSHGRGGKS